MYKGTTIKGSGEQKELCGNGLCFLKTKRGSYIIQNSGEEIYAFSMIFVTC